MNRKLKDAKYCSSANFKRKAEVENVDETGQNKEEIKKKMKIVSTFLFLVSFITLKS